MSTTRSAGQREPATRPAPVILRQGFRLFFPAAGFWAAAAVAIWLGAFLGYLRIPTAFSPLAWHAHEMIFGFVVAVIAGFLLTAVGNWTQRETVIGAPLLGLSALWLLGRVAMLSSQAWPRALTVLVDLSFLPCLIAVLALPLWLARSYRNLPLLGILVALFACNLAVHLAGLGVPTGMTARQACLTALDLVLVIIGIIAGRVFPLFTRNATRVATIRSSVWLDRASVVSLVALASADAAFPDTQLTAATAGLAATLAVARAWHWGARHTLRQPLLWVLHAGYVWYVVGLALRAVHGFTGAIPASLATHALTVGAIGGLTLGMMARVALGHTGRPLVVSRTMAGAFLAINGAAAARVLVPWLAPDYYFASLVAAATLWTGAFLVFVVVYTPLLTTPRIDGKFG